MCRKSIRAIAAADAADAADAGGVAAAAVAVAAAAGASGATAVGCGGSLLEEMEKETHDQFNRKSTGTERSLGIR